MTRQGVLGRARAERAGGPQRSSEARPKLIDPATLMRIGNLQLRARVVVEGFLSGLHRSPYHGFSVEFTEYRQYTPGDDPRYLDWKLYARTDRYYLKRFEDETNLRVWLLVDLSRSMSYGSVGYDKASYAKTAAATLGYFLSLQRDAVGLITFDAQVHDYLPARYRPGHLHRLMMLLERSCGGSATDLASPLAQVAQLAHKRGMVVLLSDLLAPPPTLRQPLGYLRARGHEVIVMRVIDPAERDFPFREAALFRDLESGRELYVDPELARDRYRQRLAEHEAQVRQICHALGIEWVSLPTDQPLELALFDLLAARLSRSRRGVVRRAPPTSRTSGGR
jgi:uncharacterized protein (DUF58 family)